MMNAVATVETRAVRRLKPLLPSASGDLPADFVKIVSTVVHRCHESLQAAPLSDSLAQNMHRVQGVDAIIDGNAMARHAMLS